MKYAKNLKTARARGQSANEIRNRIIENETAIIGEKVLKRCNNSLFCWCVWWEWSSATLLARRAEGLRFESRSGQKSIYFCAHTTQKSLSHSLVPSASCCASIFELVTRRQNTQ